MMINNFALASFGDFSMWLKPILLIYNLSVH